jgi:hypothetical protein
VQDDIFCATSKILLTQGICRSFDCFYSSFYKPNAALSRWYDSIASVTSRGLKALLGADFYF